MERLSSKHQELTNYNATASLGQLQRAAIHPSHEQEAPPIVHDVLRSPGRPLDAASRADFESRFGHDFSRVPLQAKLKVNRPGDSLERDADRAAAQAMEGAVTSEPRAGESVSPMYAPPIVHEVLRSPGRPLDAETRAFMELRFGHDFGAVRVHTGAMAAASVEAVDALAFTVGRDVVFGRGRHAPETAAGRQLLAHELAHVVQGSQSATIGLQRQQPARPRPAAVDADAQRIIDLAQNSRQPIAERAVAVVQAIIDQYYPADRSKISRIVYEEDDPGVSVASRGRGANTTGVLTVGRYYVENTTQAHFARRVLQVRHEIEHVEQYRAGMTGRGRQNEREFIAFYHEALATERPGTGRIQHSTRVSLIDAALGYYHCLSDDLRQQNASRRDELLARRTEAVRRSNNRSLGESPTTCRRQ